MKSKAQFYQKHLNRVSRSFAFCIEELPQPYKEWVGLSYILCRMADTIEDMEWPNITCQLAAFDQFLNFIETPPTPEQVKKWVDLFNIPMPEGEKKLMTESHKFISDFHQLDQDVQNKIRTSLFNMVKGMKYFCQKKRYQKILKLNSLIETNQYCFFVAGVVGELLTQLFSIEWPSFIKKPRVYTDAYHFGLYLQKINLLKDQNEDEKEGRYFISSRKEVLSSLHQNAHRAFAYIKSIPPKACEFKLFCCWSFFLGLASLPWIERAWESRKDMKISRAETFKLLQHVKNNIEDNQALEELFNQHISAQEKLPQISAKTPPDWFRKIYIGRLENEAYAELGLAQPANHSI